MLAGSIYGVMRVGRPGLATGPDDFGLADGAFYDGAAVGAGVGAGALRHKQQHRQQQRHHLHGGSDVHDVHSSEAGALHLHDDVHDRRAAMEERHAATAASAALTKAAAEATLAQQAGQQQRQDAQEQQQQPAVHHSADVEAWDAIGAADTGPDASQVQQAQLEAQHLAELHHLEAQLGGPGSLAQLHPDPDVAAAVAAHIAEQQAMPRREGPSLYSANLSGEGRRGRTGGGGRGCGRGLAPGGGLWRRGAGRPARGGACMQQLAPLAVHGLCEACRAAAAQEPGALMCPPACRPRLPPPPHPAAVDIHGQVLHTADLMGRVTVIVNVASQCGYTGEPCWRAGLGQDQSRGRGPLSVQGAVPWSPGIAALWCPRLAGIPPHLARPLRRVPPPPPAEANYRGLSRIHQRYKDFGLEVLAFPCNQARRLPAHPARLPGKPRAGTCAWLFQRCPRACRSCLPAER